MEAGGRERAESPRQAFPLAFRGPRSLGPTAYSLHPPRAAIGEFRAKRAHLETFQGLLTLESGLDCLICSVWPELSYLVGVVPVKARGVDGRNRRDKHSLWHPGDHVRLAPLHEGGGGYREAGPETQNSKPETRTPQPETHNPEPQCPLRAGAGRGRCREGDMGLR